MHAPGGGSVAAAALIAGVAADTEALRPDRFLASIYTPLLERVTSTNLRNRALATWARERAMLRGRPRNGRVATVEGNVSNASRLELRGLAYPVLAARVTG